MSKVFFIADTHFGHNSILKYRTRFKTIQEHDETIIENWNKVVRKAKYQVWMLGDFCFKNKYYDMEALIKRLNGTIHVILGNHCHVPYYSNVHISPPIKKYGLWLSHFPIHPQELRGLRNVHGHVHDETIDDDRYINVSADVVNYTPVEIGEVKVNVSRIAP